MKAILLNLHCITNLHVGNGEVNYNIIDNEVERDSITGFPTINASGVKGALRSFLKNKASKEQINKWFGSEGNEGGSGQLKIFCAEMIAMPARATEGERAFYTVQAETMKKKYEEYVEIFGLKNSLTEQGTENKKIAAEGIPLSAKYSFFGKDVYSISDDKFNKIALPVIARNKLEEGESKNLWYEEVVPHESLFYVPVLTEDDSLLEEFKKAIDGKVVQFGGNASLGYGLCKVTVTE